MGGPGDQTLRLHELERPHLVWAAVDIHVFEVVRAQVHHLVDAHADGERDLEGEPHL